MAGEPRTYLSFSAVEEGHNFSQYTSPNAGSSGADRVHAGAHRTDHAGVDIDDLTLASSSGEIYHNSTHMTAMPYGVAESCSAPQGVANVDLTGTPFKTSSPFCTGGAGAAGGVTFSQNDQVADILGRGYCG